MPLPEPLRTIGYEGATITHLTTTLLAAGVTLLIDVRALPLSRKPGFSKRQLAATLDEAGIAYLHLRALGTPKPGRLAARAGRTAEMRHIFATHMTTPEARFQLAEAATLTPYRPTCLLCFEADPHCCHRTMVAEMIRDSTHQPIQHLSLDQSLPVCSTKPPRC